MTKTGYIGIVGRQNVGKSTLLNCLLGKKLSITSPKPQTTRCQILGIKTQGDVQIVYIDTPGLHCKQPRVMNRYLNQIACSVMLEADMIIFLVDATRWTKEDELVLEKLRQVTVPVLLAINKIDKLPNKAQLLPLIATLSSKFHFIHVIPICALDANNVELLEQQTHALLLTGPHLFPSDQITNKDTRFQVAEMIREQLIKTTEEEVPYATTVSIEEWQQDERLLTVSAVIWVERDGQKAIVIGKKGEHLKKIGTAARREMEKILGQKVFLRLWVKIKKHWTDDHHALRNFGYQ